MFQKLEITPSFSAHLVSGLVRLDGSVVTILHYPNGNFDLSEQVSQRLRRTLRLSPDEFDRFSQCYMSKQHYLGLLRDRVEVVSFFPKHLPRERDPEADAPAVLDQVDRRAVLEQDVAHQGEAPAGAGLLRCDVRGEDGLLHLDLDRSAVGAAELRRVDPAGVVGVGQRDLVRPLRRAPDDEHDASRLPGALAPPAALERIQAVEHQVVEHLPEPVRRDVDRERRPVIANGHAERPQLVVADPDDGRPSSCTLVSRKSLRSGVVPTRILSSAVTISPAAASTSST